MPWNGKRNFIFCIPALLLFALAAAGETGGGIMKVTSPEFTQNQLIPDKFTCEGKDINPALIIEGVPKEAKSLALIVYDPDAPGGTWYHWLVFDIPVTGRITEDSIPGKQGINSAGQTHYHGPCPPSGTHRYCFKVYALDALLNLKEGITRNTLEDSMQRHVLARQELTGLYKR